jgi:hypothetical protein
MMLLSTWPKWGRVGEIVLCPRGDQGFARGEPRIPALRQHPRPRRREGKREMPLYEIL